MICKRGINVGGSRVPCGQCMNCRVNQQRSWAARILMEWTTHPQMAYFLTLTYDDDHVPRTLDGNLTLNKKEFTDWVEETQRTLGRFRYYGVGEYGDKHKRPHYHMALFPASDAQAALVTGKWTKGFTSSYPFSQERAQYLAKYTTKRLTKDTDERLEAGQQPEFRTSTRKPPIGSPFVSVLLRAYGSGPGKKVLEDRGDVERSFRLGGKIYPIPRYILEQVREGLGVPRLHSERMAHPGYYSIHAGKEHAEWEPDEALAQEIQHHAKQKALSIRNNRL